MKNFFAIIKFIWLHPLSSRNKLKSFKNFFSWQLSQKIIKKPVLVPFVEDSVLLIEKGMTGATGNFYTGLLEFEDMAFILHALRKDDLFADIGANVGVYTILASKNAGARSIAVEPIPSTFKTLKNNILLNDISLQVTLMQYGVGDKSSVIKFTKTFDTVNHVVSINENFESKDVIEIPVKTLDNIFKNETPVIMKMDVEGFEAPALEGARNLLSGENLKAIVIELNSSGERYGFKDADIHNLLLSYSFHPYKYDPFMRSIKRLNTFGNLNTIYIKSDDWVNARIKSAKKFKILGQDI